MEVETSEICPRCQLPYHPGIHEWLIGDCGHACCLTCNKEITGEISNAIHKNSMETGQVPKDKYGSDSVEHLEEPEIYTPVHNTDDTTQGMYGAPRAEYQDKDVVDTVSSLDESPLLAEFPIIEFPSSFNMKIPRKGSLSCPVSHTTNTFIPGDKIDEGDETNMPSSCGSNESRVGHFEFESREQKSDTDSSTTSVTKKRTHIPHEPTHREKELMAQLREMNDMYAKARKLIICHQDRVDELLQSMKQSKKEWKADAREGLKMVKKRDERITLLEENLSEALIWAASPSVIPDERQAKIVQVLESQKYKTSESPEDSDWDNDIISSENEESDSSVDNEYDSSKKTESDSSEDNASDSVKTKESDPSSDEESDSSNVSPTFYKPLDTTVWDQAAEIASSFPSSSEKSSGGVQLISLTPRRDEALRVEFRDLTVTGPLLRHYDIRSRGQLWREVIPKVCHEIHRKYQSFHVTRPDGASLDLDEAPSSTHDVDVVRVVVMPVDDEASGLDRANQPQWQSWRAIHGNIEIF